MPLVDKGEVTAQLTSGEPKCIVEYHMGVPLSAADTTPRIQPCRLCLICAVTRLKY